LISRTFFVSNKTDNKTIALIDKKFVAFETTETKTD